MTNHDTPTVRASQALSTKQTKLFLTRSATSGPEGGEVMDPDEMNYDEMNGLEAITEFLEILDRLPHVPSSE